MNSGKEEGNHKELKSISLVVDNEQDLYTPLSPDPEFNFAVKQYLKTKAADVDDSQNIKMTVLSKKPIDEEKFRSAVSNFIQDEKRVLKIEEKDTIRMLIGLLVFGSVFILLSLSLEKMIDVLKYSLMPIMGSLALSRAVHILIMELPTIHARKWIINGLEKNSVIIFKYDQETISNTMNNEA